MKAQGERDALKEGKKPKRLKLGIVASGKEGKKSKGQAAKRLDGSGDKD